ncbi:hypothetical protein G4B88_020626 [Cannabis sativa]|uniref:Flap endonuclease 1 n=1 Tax=Cannabis sativa TaxID=3483 RepID=A0A7J6E674_CANSA|nr:hypothetical protein G4B88_031293 [Cannabis sativa]KAF4359082.1 hypothetical protein G4B88_020626 [Cannabis sativa]
MGIKGLTKLLADNAPKSMKEQKFESYFGRKIAVDASMSIYQFLIVVGRSGAEMLTNEAGEVTSHLQGMFARTIRLLEAGIKPVYVFDGKPPEMKKQELAKRYSKRADATEDLAAAMESGNKEDIEKFSKRTVKVTKQHNDDCKRLLKLMGVPVIEAPSEAEAQCAALCKSGKARKSSIFLIIFCTTFNVYGVASEDMDSLTFGAPRFLRHLMDPSSRKIPVMEFEVAKILEELNLTMDQFIDLCILSGCDYCENIRGIGGLTALKLIRQHGSIENILENLNKERYQIPDNWPYQEARQLFKEPNVYSNEEEPEIKWTAPDEEGLIAFLVNENGFNSDRVTKAIEKIKVAKNKSSQGRLESFFKPVANSAVPIKRKGSKCVLRPPKPALKHKVFSLKASNSFGTKIIGGLSLPILDLGFRHSIPLSKGETPVNTAAKAGSNKKAKAGGGKKKK